MSSSVRSFHCIVVVPSDRAVFPLTVEDEVVALDVEGEDNKAECNCRCTTRSAYRLIGEVKWV